MRAPHQDTKEVQHFSPTWRPTSFVKAISAHCAWNPGHHTSNIAYLDLCHTLYHPSLFLKLRFPAAQASLGVCTYHMENTSRLDGLESSDRDAVVSMAIAEAAALHDEVVDGIVQGWWGLRGRAGREAGAALPLQQPHPQVGDLQLRLGFRAVRVLRGVRR